MPGGSLAGGQSHTTCATFESNVPFVLRFLIDCDISGSNWIELPRGAYTLRPAAECLTYTQVGLARACYLRCLILFSALLSVSST